MLTEQIGSIALNKLNFPHTGTTSARKGLRNNHKQSVPVLTSSFSKYAV